MMAKMSFEEDGKMTTHWERAYVVGYSPLDETVMLKFFDDGEMTDYLGGLVDSSDIKSVADFSEVFELGGGDIRYLHPRPKEGTEEAVGWKVKAYVAVGEEDDEDGGEEAVYDWVVGRISGLMGSKDDEERMVFVVVSDDKGYKEGGGVVSDSESRASGEEMREYECDIDEPLELQFLEDLRGKEGVPEGVVVEGKAN